MNWDAIGAFGEIIGALAVGVSLIYLTVQVRHVKKDLHVSGYREVNKIFIDVSQSLTPELARILVKQRDGDTLEDWESIMLDEYFFRWMTVLEVGWEHITSGAINVPHDIALSTVRSYLDKPGFKEWWQRNRSGFFDHWQEIVDESFNAIEP